MTSCVVVLDDDPTGTQAVVNAKVIIDTSPGYLETWLDGHAPQPVYVSTNTRALAPAAARELVAQVAGIVRAHWPGARLICRGGSTLRGHLLQEYRGLAGRSTPPVLFVPAMPVAGRVTLSGQHYLIADGCRTPVSDTEYARDSELGYTHSDLLRWAEQRSSGVFAAADGEVVHLSELRAGGAEAVAASLARIASRDKPAALTCDAMTDTDLLLIGEGIRLAWKRGTPVVVRCAPPLAALLTGLAAAGYCTVPSGARRLLVVVGSYVQATTRQLAEFSRRHPGAMVEADLSALVQATADEQQRLVGLLEQSWATGPVAVLATPRQSAAIGPGTGLAIAAGLAGTVAALRTRPDAVIVRGGVTSAVIARDGLRAREALVTGPAGPGIALWQLDGAADGLPLLIAAGNVGQPADLANLVDQIVGRPGPPSGPLTGGGKGAEYRNDHETRTRPGGQRAAAYHIAEEQND